MDSNQNTFIPNDSEGAGINPAVPNYEKAATPALQTAGTDTEVKEKKCCSKSNGCCRKKANACCSGTHKLEVYNWLEDLPEITGESQMVEVQFKNTRKGYYLNSNNIEVFKGDIVAVEASPGHDIGEVTLTGKLVQLQMLKNNYRGDTKRIYRIAKPNDIDKWNEAKAKEHKTMLRAREIAEDLKLDMKISDVEFQGDGNKAIFYYIADERVDFRQLIKVYASEFRVKIEMKQIGARQEAGRVGGIGPCGRELCCSSSMSNFISVSTSAARLQDIPLNPQKLAGQCGKLKCCLNFEVDTYVEAQRKLPSREIVLETKDASYYHFKTDILSGDMTYSTDKHFAANLITLSKDRVYEVIRMNKQGGKPTHLSVEVQEQNEKPTSHDILQENINRFDNSGNNNRNNKKKKFSKNKPENSGPKGHNNQGNNNKPENNKLDNSAKQLTKPANRPENNNQQGNNQSQNHNRNNKHRNNRNDRNRHNNNGKPDQKKPEA
ncbi:regulatory iron-sulfur-containing complex subunit RicT [Prevotella sp. 10(H)]|uniref:PSP1 domain-containing protein n=1 Tax=Prevotella sp. 10(H) TaxID=1158294 RepID=UPI0004A747E9|nr:regulatory iron-sulfur-containing complex subunit RicT [Prevotella sp. 10(H)]